MRECLKLLVLFLAPPNPPTSNREKPEVPPYFRIWTSFKRKSSLFLIRSLIGLQTRGRSEGTPCRTRIVLDPKYAASSIWGFLERPCMFRSFSRSTQPSFSGIRNRKELCRERRKNQPFESCLFFRLAHGSLPATWPLTRTSPRDQKGCPVSSMYALAFFSMKILQSMPRVHVAPVAVLRVSGRCPRTALRY